MIPIQELLSRIVWDKDFGQGDFEIGYYDRIEDKIIRIPFREMQLNPSDHFSFYLYGSAGEAFSVPFHRIRAVYKDGRLIWER